MKRQYPKKCSECKIFVDVHWSRCWNCGYVFEGEEDA